MHEPFRVTDPTAVPRSIRPAIGGIALLALGVTVAGLRWEGRRWWCRFGGWSPWSAGIGGEHTSQHLFDPYSFTHVVHGVLFYALIRLILPGCRWDARLLATGLLEAAWELAENSAPFIARYRAATVAAGYVGDSVANSLGDIASCLLGFALARTLPVRWTISLCITIEAILIASVRDSLLLNVLMLIHPVEAIRAWQAGG